jgi:non-ribosomal peptide synthetase component F
MFNHQVATRQATAGNCRRRAAPLEITRESARFDLALNTEEQGERLSASLLYATDLFEARTIERLGQHWAQLLGAAWPSRRGPSKPCRWGRLPRPARQMRQYAARGCTSASRPRPPRIRSALPWLKARAR